MQSKLSMSVCQIIAWMNNEWRTECFEVMPFLFLSFILSSFLSFFLSLRFICLFVYMFSERQFHPQILQSKPLWGLLCAKQFIGLFSKSFTQNFQFHRAILGTCVWHFVAGRKKSRFLRSNKLSPSDKRNDEKKNNTKRNFLKILTST